MKQKREMVIWSALVGLMILPWIIFFLRTQPSDVLLEVKSFRRELVESRKEVEEELLQRTQSRMYYHNEHPNIWELIDANDLKVPEGWKR